MNNELIISADELFYLGKLMNAKYIDYAYIVCMNDSAEDFKIREKRVKQELIKKELIFESFSGKIDVDESVLKMLSPIFEGKKESSLNICYISEQTRAEIIKFHFTDNNVIMVRPENGLLMLTRIQLGAIDNIVSGLFEGKAECTEKKIIKDIGGKSVSVLVSVKSIVLGEKSSVCVFVQSNGDWYIDKGRNTFESIGREEMTELIIQKIKE